MEDSVEDVKIGLSTIWAIGVGSVLGGDFFGWQFITYGGVLPAFFSIIIAAIFYWLYAAAITELAARYRTTGGAFDFVRRSQGEKWGIAMAILGLLKLFLANAALALSISSYLSEVGLPKYLQFLCWVVTYGIFTGLDCIGVRQSAFVQVLATVLCLLILLFYCCSALTKFESQNLVGEGNLTRGGFLGFFMGLPFALQFFDGFEETPLLMEYAHEPTVTIPRGIAASYVSVAIVSFSILFAGCGITNIDVLIDSEAPLMEGIDTVYGKGTGFSDLIAIFIVIGLLVNFFAFVLFCSQQIQAIAEAGRLPSALAYRHPVHGAPITASIASSLCGVLLCAGFSTMFDEAVAQNTLVTAALMPAVLGYILVLECIVRIRDVEDKIESTGYFPTATSGVNAIREKIGERDAYLIGYIPEVQLRFPYGVKMIRFAQFLCVLFIIGLFILASVSIDFLYGLIIILVLGVSLFGIMSAYAAAAGSASSTENDDVLEINLGNPLAGTSTTTKAGGKGVNPLNKTLYAKLEQLRDDDSGL